MDADYMVEHHFPMKQGTYSPLRLNDLVDGCADIWRLRARHQLHCHIAVHVNAKGDPSKRLNIAHKGACTNDHASDL